MRVGYMRAERTWSAPTRPSMKSQDAGGRRDMDVDYLGRRKSGRTGGTPLFKGRGNGQSQKPSTGQQHHSTPKGEGKAVKNFTADRAQTTV